MIAKAWDFFIAFMIISFLISIISSLAQGELVRIFWKGKNVNKMNRRNKKEKLKKRKRRRSKLR